MRKAERDGAFAFRLFEAAPIPVKEDGRSPAQPLRFGARRRSVMTAMAVFLFPTAVDQLLSASSGSNKDGLGTSGGPSTVRQEQSFGQRGQEGGRGPRFHCPSYAADASTAVYVGSQLRLRDANDDFGGWSRDRGCLSTDEGRSLVGDGSGRGGAGEAAIITLASPSLSSISSIKARALLCRFSRTLRPTNGTDGGGSGCRPAGLVSRQNGLVDSDGGANRLGFTYLW